VRQSSPPRNNALISTGATIFGDEEKLKKGRERDLNNLAELDRNGNNSKRASIALDLVVP
jgi:hypothetical protein